MATFRIHEDLEKENRVQTIKTLAPTSTANVALKQAAQTRSTFGVLNNLTSNARSDIQVAAAIAEKTLLKDAKLKIKPNLAAGKTIKPHEEKVIQQQPLELVSTTSSSSRQFDVYDESKENVPGKQIAKKQPEQSSLNDSKREPLQELKTADDVLLETPMSVGESLSPMSVDKSMLALEEASAAVTSSGETVSRNDRDRFFEVEEYLQDILSYLQEAEKRHRPKPAYMKKQPDINQSMRTILVDWLVEVCEEYRLQNETLCLAISYIDRFLSFMSVVRAKLQLVGTAAMFIAAKYEEIYPPDVGEFVYITDDTYTKSQVLRMEQLILKVLSFDLSVPTTLVFTTIYCVMNNIPDKIKYMSMYLCELSLLEADPYLTYLPSKIAAGALALSRYILDLPVWSRTLEKNTGYRLSELKDIVLDLARLHQRAESLGQQAIQEKYKGNKYMQVATVPAVELDEEMFENMCKSLAALAAAKENVTSTENTSDTPTGSALGANDSVREMMSSLLFV